MSNIIRIPVFPLNTVLFPGMTLPLRIFEDRYKKMLVDCMDSHSLFGVCLIKKGDEVGSSSEFFGIGTVAKIDKVWEVEHGYDIRVLGQEIFRIKDILNRDEYVLAEVELLGSLNEKPFSSEKQIIDLKLLVEDYLNSINLFQSEWFSDSNIPSSANKLINFVISILQSSNFDLQIILEQLSGQSRVDKLIQLLEKETRSNQLTFVDQFIGNKSILN